MNGIRRFSAVGYVAGLVGLGILILGASRTARADIYGDAMTKRYHTADCPEKKKIKARYLKVFAAEAEAGGQTYYPCPICIPPLGKPIHEVAARRQLSSKVSHVAGYIGDETAKVVHNTWCRLVGEIAPGAARKFASVEKAETLGYARCQECSPPPSLNRSAIAAQAAAPKAEPEAPAPKAGEGAEEPAAPKPEADGAAGTE